MSVAGPLVAERWVQAGAVGTHSISGPGSSPPKARGQQQAAFHYEHEQQPHQHEHPAERSPERSPVLRQQANQVGAQLLGQLISSAVNVQASMTHTSQGLSTGPKAASLHATATPRSSLLLGLGGGSSSKEGRTGTAGENTRAKAKAKDAQAVAATAGQSKESVAELAASMVTPFVGLQPNLGLNTGAANRRQEAQPLAFTHSTEPMACRVGRGVEATRNTPSPVDQDTREPLGLELMSSSGEMRSSYESADVMSSSSSMDESPRVGAPA